MCRGVAAFLGNRGVAVKNEDPVGVCLSDGLDGNVITGVRVGAALNFKRGLEAQKIEDWSPCAALGRSNVADVATGNVHGHDGGLAIVSLLCAVQRIVEVIDQLLRVFLMSKNLAEVGDLTDELFIKRLTVTWLEVDQRDSGVHFRNLRIKSSETLTGDDQIGV